MNRVFPTRSNSHNLEELSDRFFRGSMPRNWVAEKPSSDYGIDLRVEIFEENKATGREFLVQLKASAKSSGKDTETVRIETSTYNYLSSKLQIAMLVKFIESDKEAYWLLIRDIPAPSKDHKTFTVHIPRVNRLSSIQWPEIQAQVHSVTDEKLAVTHRGMTGQKSSASGRPK